MARWKPLALAMGRKRAFHFLSLQILVLLIKCFQLFEKLRFGGCRLVFVADVKSQAHLISQLVFCVTKNVSAHCTLTKNVAGCFVYRIEASKHAPTN